MPKINLQASLTQVAGMAGLGTSGIYTVKSKDVVVQLDLKIVMEADKVEKVIVERSDSLLRRTINDTITDVQNNSKNATITAQKIKPEYG
jgi:tRNA(Phe) wybutosine-synthesizing methylase Tyw3